MKARVPSIAAWRVRATGASAKCAPRSVSLAASSRARATGAVLQSTIAWPARAASLRRAGQGKEDDLRLRSDLRNGTRRGDAVERETLQRRGPQIVGEDLAAVSPGKVAAHGLAHHAQADETELVHRSSRRRSLLQVGYHDLLEASDVWRDPSGTGEWESDGGYWYWLEERPAKQRVQKREPSGTSLRR